MANNLVMYAQGGDYSSLYNSGFTTVILNSFHIHSDGSLWWNDTEVVTGSGTGTSNMPALQAVVSGLQSNGIGTVLLSVGGRASSSRIPTVSTAITRCRTATSRDSTPPTGRPPA